MNPPLLKLIPALGCCASFAVRAEELKAPDFSLPSGTVPTTIFGNVCKMIAGDANFAPRLDCKGTDVVKDPSILISMVDSKCERSSEQMMADRRRLINDGTPFFNVVWQQEFLPASVPSGVGYRGFYQLSMGNRYWWETCGNGKLTRVSVIMFSPTNNDALKADIEEKVFGVGQSSATVPQESNP
jgi:hypothetical protein